jgi:hypothetical protein
LEEALTYLLELRLRCRGNPEATAIVDRGLALLARAETADAAEMERIEADLERLRVDLAERFGAPPTLVRH